MPYEVKLREKMPVGLRPYVRARYRAWNTELKGKVGQLVLTTHLTRLVVGHSFAHGSATRSENHFSCGIITQEHLLFDQHGIAYICVDRYLAEYSEPHQNLPYSYEIKTRVSDGPLGLYSINEPMSFVFIGTKKVREWLNRHRSYYVESPRAFKNFRKQCSMPEPKPASPSG